VPSGAMLLVPPATLRIMPTVTSIWTRRKWMALKIPLEPEVTIESALLMLLVIVVVSVQCSYQRDSRPSVASSSGDRPTDWRIKYVSIKPLESDSMVASSQHAPTIRTRQRMRVKMKPELRPKPWRLHTTAAPTRSGK